MNKTDLIRCLAKIDLSDSERKAMLSQILKQRHGAATSTPARRSVRRLSTAAVAVILLFALALPTALAVGFGWHHKLIEYLAPSQEQMETLEPAVGRPETAMTQQGITVEIIQTLADARGVYVLYEIDLPSGTIPDGVDWRFTSFYVSTEENPQGSGFAQFSNKALDITGNKVTMLFHIAQSDNLAAGHAVMDLCDLLLYREGEPKETIEGIWHFEWDLAYDDAINRFIDANREIVIGQRSLTVNRIIISPMSVYLSLTGNSGALDFENSMIHFADGTEVYFGKSENTFIYSMETGQDQVTIEIYHRFDQLIDPAEVMSVTLGGENIPLP